MLLRPPSGRCERGGGAPRGLGRFAAGGKGGEEGTGGKGGDASVRTRGAPPLGGLTDGWTRRRPAGVEGRGLYASRLRALHLGYELCISATSCTQTPSAAGQGQASRTSTEMGECVHAPHGFTVRFMHCRVRDGRGRGHVLRTDGWYTHTLSVGTRTAFYKRGGGLCAEPWSDFVDVVSVLVTRRVRVCALWLCACG